jgi:hypothetical protein
VSLYERILKEAEREGLEYRPPQTSSRRDECTGDLGMLKMWTLHPPSNHWTAMAFRSLQHKYPLEYEKFLLQKNGGKWMIPFWEKEGRS